MKNAERVQKGFNILLPHFSIYIAKEFEAFYQDEAKDQAILTLSDQIEKLAIKLPWVEFVQSLDLSNCIRLFERKWSDLFSKKLSLDFRTWAKELHGVRNKLAHLGLMDYQFNDTWRALDTTARLCDAFDDQAAEEIRDIIRELLKEEPMYAPKAGEKTKPSDNPPQSSTHSYGLPCWREVIKPHRDVMEGKYSQAEFAADLAQVAQGKGSYEYRDAVEFFARTYITEGMRDLLAQALKRINGKGGDPVVQLKTAFGGGKTHSMLALYHMLRGKTSIEKLPNLASVLDYAGVYSLPRANVAVLVGTALNPSKSRRPINMPGVTINTFWGEMVAQLAESCGRPELYDYIKESDKKRVSPGAEVFCQIFDECGSCLVLMDEIVAYARKLYKRDDLPAGSFENFLSFIQEVTEGAKASKNSVVVASIPESEIEIGGEAGKLALDAIEHTFGRVEAIWKPITAREGYEIVRRRLFAGIDDESKRDDVCRAFDKMYMDYPNDFPVETRDGSYLEQMKACYPIHPEVFDRLYNDWSTLDNFQRTRGVLRLMATVIHELWIKNDADLLIMPSSFPLDSNNVHNELTRYLPQEWNGIVDAEVDGKKSIPFREDVLSERYGQCQAARRVARTIMLGSAPTSRGQAVRGLDITRIHLGTVQNPDTIPVYRDALNTLRGKLSYLYATASGDRFWFDTRPTLRKTAEERASKIASSDIELEIERRIQRERVEKPFAGICLLPESSKDVPDEQKFRLVVLPPAYAHKLGKSESRARDYALEIVKMRGEQARLYRNTLVFLSADQDGMSQLQQEVRIYLAWQSIHRDKEQLNLDSSQIRETENAIKSSDITIKAQIKETFVWLFVPSMNRSKQSEIELEESRLAGGSKGTIMSEIIERMRNDETIIENWSPKLLKMELDQLLWKDMNAIQVQDLWGKLCQYCYLPRLANFQTLAQAIQDGAISTEYWGVASGLVEQKFADLRLGKPVGSINESDWLVKPEFAKEHISRDNGESSDNSGSSQNNGASSGVQPTTGTGGIDNPPTPKPELLTRFYLSKKVNAKRALADVQQLIEEVILHLTEDYDCQVEITLDVQASKKQGFDHETMRTINENCNTLKVDDFGFDKL